MNAQLGGRYRDRITGFEGIATSIHEYLHGCRRVTLTGGKPDDPKDLSFDEPSLELVLGGVHEPSQATGGPHGLHAT